MIFGSVKVIGKAVETHRHTYLLSQLSVISLQRPFLPTAALFAAGGSGFGLAFSDLLYGHELVILASSVLCGLIGGMRIAQIQLLSRDLRGSELSCMIWGSYGHLNRLRREIAAAMQAQDAGSGRAA